MYHCTLHDQFTTLFIRFGTNITQFTLTYDLKVSTPFVAAIAQLPLTHLTLRGCSKLGSQSIQSIATMENLQYLDLSYIPGIWTQHLRRLADLPRLLFLCHVDPQRSRSNTTFNVLTGLWPLLETITVEETANRRSLAETFGPLVSVIYERILDPVGAEMSLS
jgi:hypothetical protein